MKTLYVYTVYGNDVYVRPFFTSEDARAAATYDLNHTTDSEKRNRQYAIQTYHVNVPDGDTRTAQEVYDDLLDDGADLNPDEVENLKT